MELPVLEIALRTETGKGPARRLRGKGFVPAVLYGQTTEPINLSVSPKSLKQALSGPLHINTVLKLAISDGSKKAPSEHAALVCDHQYDPVSRELLHVDFLTVDMAKPIRVEIPFKTTGRSLGEQIGGTMSVTTRELPVDCLPAQIPESFVIDVTELKIGDGLTVADLTLPEGVTIALPEDTTLVSIVSTKVEEEEVKEDEEEGEAAAEDGEKSEAPAADDKDKEKEKASS